MRVNVLLRMALVGNGKTETEKFFSEKERKRTFFLFNLKNPIFHFQLQSKNIGFALVQVLKKYQKNLRFSSFPNEKLFNSKKFEIF